MELSVSLHNKQIGSLYINSGGSIFVFSEEYLNDSDRKVLGLGFEERLTDAPQLTKDDIHPWFANLFPEGGFSRVLKSSLGINEKSKRYEQIAQLLAQVGADLPGAVSVIPKYETGYPSTNMNRTNSSYSEDASGLQVNSRTSTDSFSALSMKFSLAGIQVKFSADVSSDRFTLPASSSQAKWFVKPPAQDFPHLPENEHAVMQLAAHAGLNVAHTKLVSKEQFRDVPDRVWAGKGHGLAIERFDRTNSGPRIHMEDLAQVRFYNPRDKYKGTFETIGAYFYRGRDQSSLLEFSHRLAFNLLLGNHDAHLKNWSLLYPDGRNPRISPAYDLVSVIVYPWVTKDIGLKFGNRRHYSNISLDSFDRLSRKIEFSEFSITDSVRQFINALLPDYLDVLSGAGMHSDHLLLVRCHVNEMKRLWDL
ncbi:type II toxin-antitoxin system HipA family toxin [Kocuria sp. cx-455]|uniref:type II toxin-antitoxin system HipA family toxin n=1 Tax=Kocuria sp. cx-455 TaxID=2771377 RepID=UPI003D70EBF9